jgi:hypothetical protein
MLLNQFLHVYLLLYFYELVEDFNLLPIIILIYLHHPFITFIPKSFNLLHLNYHDREFLVQLF